MNPILRLTLTATVALPVLAFGADCASIKADKARLACYDTGAATEKPSTSNKAATPTAKTAFRSGFWTVDQSINAMTDKKSCVALYKGDWNIQGGLRYFFISMRGRGGVKYYTVRINDEPAQGQQRATESESDLGSLILEPYFDQLYDGKRLRVQIGTIIGGMLGEDIDLKGFRESVDFIRENCPK
ncbi:hypothetical protein [Duganella violaceipulchra]|uniref:Uncharacterized protein n=1 Tax=Duganella violaceipulchra TaxID=2849652 RepID=A0AA41HD41_9BURK|nr:hypothetical protein [Duganella violaceicalia]MBV6321951.1 hypothetical protein [Duganella violaceicalia]MCP2007054.1 hypothetical protein [Duganella violaceicalia]